MEEEERPEVVVDLADVDRETGAVLIADCQLELNTLCDLVVRGGAGEVRFAARVVFSDPERGSGLEVLGYGAELRDQLAALDLIDTVDTPIEPDEPQRLALNHYQRLRGLTLAQQVMSS